VAVNNVLLYVEIVLISVLYVQDLVQETLLMLLRFVLFVKKSAMTVQLNVVNMQIITKVARFVLKPVENVRKLVIKL
jgi:hypothetical protein